LRFIASAPWDLVAELGDDPKVLEIIDEKDGLFLVRFIPSSSYKEKHYSTFFMSSRYKVDLRALIDTIQIADAALQDVDEKYAHSELVFEQYHKWRGGLGILGGLFPE
jgi:hypothetical protein